jgi:uncharacterized protein YndB with AHSA1/START domain
VQLGSCTSYEDAKVCATIRLRYDDHMSEELLVERDVELDVDIAEAWELISTPSGWSMWLVDDAEINVEPDAHGTAITDDTERVVHIHEVVTGSCVGFTWWDRDDPASVSYVQLDVVELPDGRSRLHTSERFVGSLSMMSAIHWDVRLIALWSLAVSHFAIA